VEREPHPSPIGEAMAWVSRIIAIGLTMFLPGVAGSWLDVQLGTRFIGPAGFALGLGTALLWLIQLGNRRGADRR
jgi:hypothetical protein